MQNHLSRRKFTQYTAAAVAGTGLSSLSGIAALAAPNDGYPPTGGAMSNFVLLKERVPAPTTPFTDASGTEMTLKDFEGEVLLLNFWATWCAPCVHEMPSLDKLQASYPDGDFKVLAMSQDRGGAKKAEPFLRDKLGLPHLHLMLDPKMTLGRAFRNRGIPVSYAIDKKGYVVGSLAGIAEWDSDEARALFNSLLKEDGAAS